MKESTGRIVSNSVAVLAARMVEFVVGILTVVLAARYLGVEDFGTYSLIRTLAAALSAIMAFGSARILCRDMSVTPADAGRLMSGGLLLNGLMAAVTCAVAVGAAWPLGLTAPAAALGLALAMAAQVVLVMTRTVASAFVAGERMGYDLVIAAATRVLVLALFLVVARLRLGYVGLLAALLAADGVALTAALVIVVRRFTPPHWRGSVAALRYLVRESAPVAASTVLMQAATSVHTFFLKGFQSLQQVSLFQAPDRVLAPLSFVPNAVLVALVPMLSRLGSDRASFNALHAVYTRTLKYMLIVTVPGCAFVSLYADDLAGLLFGREFSAASGVLRIVVWTLLPVFVNHLLSFVLMSIKRQQALAVSNGLCLVAAAGAGLALIPRYGCLGAAAASLISCVVLCATSFVFVTKHLSLVRLDRLLWRPVLAAGVACAAVSAGALGPFTAAAAGAALYLGLMVLLKALDPDDWRLLLSVPASLSAHLFRRTRRGAPPLAAFTADGPEAGRDCDE